MEFENQLICMLFISLPTFSAGCLLFGLWAGAEFMRRQAVRAGVGEWKGGPKTGGPVFHWKVQDDD